jgi:alkanesulfonate monooxygenase SsuD/methylene tetrahydromethanopterin reductase-like flavin-dependent oxidoreductase (luciferase family)
MSMDKDMDISVLVSSGRPWAEIERIARAADELGAYAVYIPDHFMPNTADGSIVDGPRLEAWTLLSALSQQTASVRLGPLVLGGTYRHPAVVANMVAALDHVSGGRAIAGLGAGWQVNEHAAYGIDLPAAGPRVDRFQEAIEVIHQLFHEDRANFKGEYYALTDAPFAPRPASVPLLVGTASPRMLRLTAKWADEWNTWGDPTTIATVTEKFREACEKEGRDPATIRRSAQAMVFFSDDPERVAKLRERAPAGRSLVGGVSELVDLVGQYAELGLDELAIPDFTLGTTPEARAETYAKLKDEVLSSV